jgi:hypothetical protein
MRLLYADETNTDPSKGDFFIYGEVVIDCARAAELSSRLDTARVKAGLRESDDLKFDTNKRPSHVTYESYTEAKREAMAAAAECGVVLLTTFVLHAVSKSPEEARRYGINRIVYHFNCMLNWPESKDTGLALIDTFDDKQLRSILREKFMTGVVGLPYTSRMRLTNVVGVHLTTIGSSHFASISDIALGALRFAVNNRNESSRTPVVATLMQQLRPLFHGVKERDAVSPLGVSLDPRTIKVARYRSEYEGLRDFFATHGVKGVRVPDQG